MIQKINFDKMTTSKITIIENFDLKKIAIFGPNKLDILNFTKSKIFGTNTVNFIIWKSRSFDKTGIPEISIQHNFRSRFTKS